jgi:beta-exotoxin I transport system permease protein
MNSLRTELMFGPVRALGRATALWSVFVGALVAVTVAVWPAFRDSTAVNDIMNNVPSAIVQAFGLEGFGTPAGFLRGNLYDFFIPLLIAGAAVGFANSLTASEEDAGRLEVVLAQPVTRQAVFAGRAFSALVCTILLVAATTVVQFASDAAVNLQIGAGKLLATLVLSGLLATFHGGLALAIAGIRARPSVVLGAGLSVLVAGALISALFPLSDALKPLAHLSPWDWAFGGDPLVNGAAAWRYLALGIPSIVMATFGAWAFGHRDVVSA